MNKTKIVSLSILLITLFSTNCFATTNKLKIHEINKTVPLEEVEQFRKNIQSEITIDNVKYELQNVSEYENKETKTQEREEVKQKVVNTNNKYDVLNMFESKIEMTEDKMSGILELQNHSLDLKVNDSYIEQYKVSLTKNYENVPSNELNAEYENKETKTQEREEVKQKVVNTNNKYDVLNMFESKIEMTEDKMSGILELQNHSLDLKVNDSYIEQYKVSLTKNYENVPSNELNDVPKIIEENGITYYLINPIWNISQVEKVEGQDIPTAYNGEMKYEGIKERTIVKSYLATVTYKGILEKEEMDSITFKITYQEIPQEITEEKPNYIPIVATAGTGIVVVSGILLWRKKKNKVA